MSPQLRLELDGKKRRPRRAAGRPLWRRVLDWAPVSLALVLFVQILALGLGPAWTQRRELQRCERDVEVREEGLARDHAELIRDRRKLSDPIYRERVRRSLRNLSRPPLTLASTRDEGS